MAWAGFGAFRTGIMDTGTIGDFVYPSYLGATLLVLSIGGTIYALLDRKRLGGVAVLMLVLLWFSMGSYLNPLVRVYPFSGLDVARFLLFIAPFMALLGAALVARLLDFLSDVSATWAGRLSTVHRRRVWYAVVLGVLAAVLVFPALDAHKAQGFMSPYQVKGTVEEAMEWLQRQPEPGEQEALPIYTVGLWTWHSFLVPYLAGRPLVDGWHDEGASNVLLIRELRMMDWTGEINIARARDILLELGTEYVLVNRDSDHPQLPTNLFRAEMDAHTEWFTNVEDWGDVAVYRLLRAGDGNVTSATRSRLFVSTEQVR